ncbi:MFS general substrate transporter [Aaosphaeria arxii CBS 175.79]|uniref:MFS general substrate transporter n=1 Tax=Aaosphaeria arxii CBS 175.79 TaxID=1450172 RepID=A0A6A5XUV6_9PLEO|nr:MFS general substrate transporter [Aaosphaeria arxii CBS 175.79]KAF2017002.1 MFS general substrate transporter [Aaosphaeria arxii CBS 175.79]
MPVDLEKTVACPPKLSSEQRLTVVDWYGDGDPENPLNWSVWKKLMVVFTINYCSTMVYMSASIYTVAQPEVSQIFGVSITAASLGLVTFILGYGIGPLFFSPISELPGIGRNIPYVGALAIFVVISVPTALAQNFAALLVLRFLQGFFGSPVLSTGGASLTDICNTYQKPYYLYSWAIFSLAGPSLGTIIAGYSVPILGWRWSLWEIVIAVGPGLLFCLFLPESSATNILHRRARRLRKVMGDATYISEANIKLANSTVASRFYSTLVVPWKINALDPSILFTSLYMGLLYAVFYSFFEFFPLIYGGIYGMSTGQVGLMFLSVIVSVIIAGIPYNAFVYFVINPSLREGKEISPEGRLLPAVIASGLIPVGMFIIGWTSRASIHWFVSSIGVGLVTGGVIVILQCIFVYITLAYPHYVASLFSGNGIARAVVASGGVLWSHPMYESLGINWSMTLLGCCCAACVVGIFVLFKYGHILRAKSRFSG